MTAPSASGTVHRTYPARLWLALALIVAGLFGHLLAARAIGGSSLAYRDHLIGFVGFLVISGAIVGLIGRRFWRGRTDITALAIGVLQALLGIYVYVERFSVHG